MTDDKPPLTPPRGEGKAQRFGAKRGTHEKSPKRLATEKAQGALMLQTAVAGKPVTEIARIFNCSTSTVRKRLSLPELQEYFQTAKEVVATRLLPLALEVAEEKLEVDRDADMATKVMFGTGLLTHNARIEQQVQATVVEETYDEWRKKRLMAKEGVVEAKGPEGPQ